MIEVRKKTDGTCPHGIYTVGRDVTVNNLKLEEQQLHNGRDKGMCVGVCVLHAEGERRLVLEADVEPYRN